jgi:hypothetical protein
VSIPKTVLAYAGRHDDGHDPAFLGNAMLAVKLEFGNYGWLMLVFTFHHHFDCVHAVTT